MSAIAKRPYTPYLREGLVARPSQFARSTCFEAGHLTSVNAGWRSVRPVIDAEQCTLCLNCYMYCPDGTIAKVCDDEGTCVAVVVDYDFCKGCGVCAKVCPVPCIAMVDERAGENEGAAETAETLDETSPSSGVAGVSGVSTERVPQRREQDSMSCSPKRGLSERIEIPETPTGKGGLA
ncbi:4Fe-4S binding protein [Adlercreutzia equolifaciens]|uniref:4Fe-4S binding protein n=1 Tax=Adlercreutzia equolifaciens TaxID=446660 RepID=UPI003AF047A4